MRMKCVVTYDYTDQATSSGLTDGKCYKNCYEGDTVTVYGDDQHHDNYVLRFRVWDADGDGQIDYEYGDKIVVTENITLTAIYERKDIPPMPVE